MAESTPLLGKSSNTALCAFAFAKDTPNGKRPQAIAHRGYKAKYPENTMSAFRAAVEVGADALELDLHLTKDGVVVLSHDPTLKRCFGVDAKIVDCTWEYIQTLRTVQSPHEPMPRLDEFLEWLASPGLEHIWVILDIKLLLPTFWQAVFNNRAVLDKLDSYADSLFHAIAVALAGVQPALGRPWRERVSVGCWAAKYLPLCYKHLQGYPITHIGFSVDYARHFLQVPGVNVSLFLWTVVGPRSNHLLRETRQRKPDRAILFWTVNPVSWMKWCIRQQVDGVITDDPKRFLEVCDSYKPEEKISHPWATWKVVWEQHWRMVKKGFAFRYKHGYWIDMKTVRKYLENEPK